MRKKKQVPVLPGDQQKIDQYKHKDKSRLNNPQVGMVNNSNDPEQKTTKYSYDPHLDPTLVWTGKKEQSEIEVDTVSVHVHERIDPKTVIQQVHKSNIENYQHSLFEPVFDQRPIREEVSFYKHKNAWANRLIAGDSLLVMNSLLEKEGMAGQVQVVYIDPPYGIKYGSNFQPYTNQRDVKDGSDADLSSEPEMLKAFRDTWELGIHSYLSYLRDRLMLSRELLHESGSCFVQIGEENLHHVRELMDEVLGANNFCRLIPYTTTSYQADSILANTQNYILWYAKDKPKVKVRKLFRRKQLGDDTAGEYKWAHLPDGTIRNLTKEERAGLIQLPKGAKAFRYGPLTSQGWSETGSKDYEFEGKVYSPGSNQHWKTSVEGLDNLAKKNLLIARSNSLAYYMYLDDFPITPITNNWIDTKWGFDASSKSYVVQTNTKVVERCLLMASDPGDLVLDPTCGSGTTAYCSELWGRRWITIDTSRIAIHLAKQRLMTSAFNWYKLAHETEGVGAGLVYNKVPHITMGAIANNRSPEEEVLYDSPIVEKGIVRVSGPFTVEAIPAITVKSLSDIQNQQQTEVDSSVTRTGETARQDDWRSELQKTGVRAKGGEKIEFARVELIQGTRHLHAEAETLDGKRVLVSFGPDHAPLDQKQVEMALEEAGNLKPAPDMVLFAAFQFDPEASKDIDETNWAGVELLKAQMNTDLLTSDLKKKQSSSESFWLVGQPDVEVSKDKSGKYVITVNGFDYYNPKTGEVQSGGKKEIAMWMLDTDYDGRSIFPTQVFFPMASSKDGWNKIAKNLKAELNQDLLEKFEGTQSISFSSGDYKRCAVKIIDNRGIESFCIKNLD